MAASGGGKFTMFDILPHLTQEDLHYAASPERPSWAWWTTSTSPRLLASQRILGDGNADVLAQLLVPMSNHPKKKEFSSWNDLIVAMSVSGLRLRYRLDNSAASTADTDHCLEITEADLPER